MCAQENLVPRFLRRTKNLCGSHDEELQGALSGCHNEPIRTRRKEHVASEKDGKIESVTTRFLGNYSSVFVLFNRSTIELSRRKRKV